ncbi:MAG: glycosyltransferase family 4 protein [Candidatus Moraniibacteriota bacterium]
MRIAFIGQKGIPALSGGVEKYVEQIAKRMAQSGHEVTVYVRSHYTPATRNEWEGVRLVHTPGFHTKNLDAITYTFTAVLHALFQPYDIIHFQSIGPSTLAFIPRILKRNTLVIATFHSIDYLHKKWSWLARTFLRLGEWLICRVPKRTLVVSKDLVRHTLEKHHRVATYIPNGATVQKTEAIDKLLAFGLKPERYILSVSRLVAHKGIQHLIKAFMQLEDTNQLPNNFKLVIVGKEVDTMAYEQYLKTLSENRDTILFLGEQTGEALEQLFSSAFVFVQPSEEEGLSIALLEAMGHSLPIVASDIPANLEAVGVAATTFKSGDSEDLKKKLAYLINRPRERERLGTEAKERIQKEYSWDAITQQILAVYAEEWEKKQGKTCAIRAVK